MDKKKAALAGAGVVALMASPLGLGVASAASHSTTAPLYSTSAASWQNCTGFGQGSASVAGSVSTNPLPSQAKHTYSFGVTLSSGAPDTTYYLFFGLQNNNGTCAGGWSGIVATLTTDDSGAAQVDLGYDATKGQTYTFDVDAAPDGSAPAFAGIVTAN